MLDKYMLDKYLLENYKDIITSLIILLIILFIYTYYISYKICNNELNYYIYDSKLPGPIIMIIGGTHGNEPAGTVAIKKLIENLNANKIKIKRGKLILVPEVNYCGLKLGIRFILGIGDLNRKYPKKIGDKINSPINKKIIELANNSDFILDFHEGWGWHRKNKTSMGSSITPSVTNNSKQMAEIFLDTINKNIKNDNEKFVILTNDIDLLNLDRYGHSESTEIPGSLRYYLNLINKDYILIETTGQDNIQPIEVRTKQNEIFINKLLKQNDII